MEKDKNKMRCICELVDTAELSAALFGFQDKLTQVFEFLTAPEWLHGIVVLGVYRVLAWVVSVMLPPMTIFFPLFTILEDIGYLPRIAYNLDGAFKKCSACGKQALTMCMGFGCCARFLDPFASLLGLDGVILIAFILGLPENEIVVPIIIIMAYMAQGTITEIGDTAVLRQLLTDNGWMWVTAVSTILFSLIHRPCSTALISIKKKSGSMKWTAAAFLIPTVLGMLMYFVFATAARMFAHG